MQTEADLKKSWENGGLTEDFKDMLEDGLTAEDMSNYVGRFLGLLCDPTHSGAHGSSPWSCGEQNWCGWHDG